MANLYYQRPRRAYLLGDEQEQEEIQDTTSYSDSPEVEDDTPAPRFNVESDDYVPPPPIRGEVVDTLGINRRPRPAITPPVVGTGGTEDDIFKRVDIAPPPAIPEDPGVASTYAQAMQKAQIAEQLQPETYRKKKDKWYHNLGRGLLQGASNFVEQGGIPLLFQEGQGRTGAGFAVGNLLAGGVSNTINPYQDERLAIKREQLEAKSKLEEATALRQADLQRRLGESTIQNTAFDNRLGVENINARISGLEGKYYTDMAKANASVVAAELRAITSQIRSMGSFNPSEHPQLVQRFAELTNGGVLTKRDAKVKTFKLVPDANSNNVYKTVTFEDGTTEEGWLMDGNGKLVALDPRVKAEMIRAESYANVASIREEGATERNNADIAAAQKLAQEKRVLDKPEFILKYLNMWEDRFVRANYRQPTPDEVADARAKIEADYDNR